MTCQQIESFLLPYLDGKLSAHQQRLVEAHLQACALCGERVKGFADVSGLLEEWAAVEPSPFFNTRLEQRLAEEAASGGGWKNWLRRLALLPIPNPVFAMALLIVVSMATVLLQHSTAPTQELASQQTRVETAALSGEDEVFLYRDLAVLEDWEVLRNFDVLQELNNTRQ